MVCNAHETDARYKHPRNFVDWAAMLATYVNRSMAPAYALIYNVE